MGEMTGIGHFTLNLMSELSNHPEIEEIALFSGHNSMGTYSPALIQRILSDNSQGTRARRFRATKILPTRLLWIISRAMFYFRTLKLRDHVYVETNLIQRPFAGSSILFCHDLSVLRYRDYHPQRRVRFFDLYFEASIKSCTRIATISEAVAAEITESFGRKCDLVVYPAIDTSSWGDKAVNNEIMEAASGYILTVGSMEPRKNLDGLIRAFKQLPEELRRSYPLVFVGPEGWKNEELRSEIQDLETRAEAVRLGYVSQSELANLYSNATLFAFLSHYEGFGIPVIEAMSFGTPVLISEDPALGETAGGAAEIVDAKDAIAVSRSILELIESRSTRDELSEKAKENVQRFSWRESANTLVNAIAGLPS